MVEHWKVINFIDKCITFVCFSLENKCLNNNVMWSGQNVQKSENLKKLKKVTYKFPPKKIQQKFLQICI